MLSTVGLAPIYLAYKLTFYIALYWYDKVGSYKIYAFSMKF